jgi:single-stranded DNA-binding protein
VPVNQRVNDGEQWIDGEPTGHNVKVYGRQADAVVEQLRQGSRVIVIGRTETHAWSDRDTGEKRTTTRVIVDNHGTIGLTLPTPTRNPRPDTEQDIEKDAHGRAVRTAQPATAGGIRPARFRGGAAVGQPRA